MIKCCLLYIVSCTLFDNLRIFHLNFFFFKRRSLNFFDAKYLINVNFKSWFDFCNWTDYLLCTLYKNTKIHFRPFQMQPNQLCFQSDPLKMKSSHTGTHRWKLAKGCDGVSFTNTVVRTHWGELVLIYGAIPCHKQKTKWVPDIGEAVLCQQRNSVEHRVTVYLLL